jgi:hypothetical protein
MRLLLLILMIALLPLRSWAAVGVPIEARAVVLFAIKKVATRAMNTGARGLFALNLAVNHG